MTSIELRNQVLLSLQRALLGEITSNVRGITCSWDTSKITIVCYLQGDISEYIEESMECVATEVMADFPEHEVGIECKKLDEPESLNPYTLSAWVYRRKE
ncbi:hypothetical protein Cylst_4485 [Cylindrospermum stagnale PCC 7417]|uniref:Uncharacterized protein n=1 Tax=Cylindrospermum stagnale PCC 7417 TaxID=56107 RepID=K9X1S1_9NOST|nr:hypothetical protein [Cylindrospermum stagnale]AFZ26565.1 hypothetical protein Cylst_4485 [Cylindrospermum stagnale PCC 7417]